MANDKDKAAKPKRPPGRPKVEDRSKVAAVRLNLRFTLEQRERYHRAAAREGMTLKAWLVALCDSAAPPKGAV